VTAGEKGGDLDSLPRSVVSLSVSRKKNSNGQKCMILGREEKGGCALSLDKGGGGGKER